MSDAVRPRPVFPARPPVPRDGPRFGQDYLCHPSLALSGESYSCFNELWFIR